jgi:hypothetical protein
VKDLEPGSSAISDIGRMKKREAELKAEVARMLAAAEAADSEVRINNAGNFYAGYFEEISDAQFRAQMARTSSAR